MLVYLITDGHKKKPSQNVPWTEGTGVTCPYARITHKKYQKIEASGSKWHVLSVFLNILLTVHLSIILDNDQLDTHYKAFIIILYMFRALHAHHQEFELYWCIWYRHSVSGRPVHRLREFSLNLCTGRPLTESDDTRSCINTIQPPDDVYIMIKTCRGL